MKKILLSVILFICMVGFVDAQYVSPSFNPYYDYSRSYNSYNSIQPYYYGNPQGYMTYGYRYRQNYNSYNYYPLYVPVRPLYYYQPRQNGVIFIW